MRILCAAIACFLLGPSASAQTVEVPTPIVEPTDAPAAIETPDWGTVARRAETLVGGDVASLYSLTRLRSELFDWREVFAVQRAESAGRIRTVNAQIKALGEPNEDEAADVALRRTALDQKLQVLRGPVLLSEESHARADGLISEIDAQIRARDRSALTERGVSPLNPEYWTQAAAAVGRSVTTISNETSLGLRQAIASGGLQRNGPLAGLFLIVATVLLLRGRKWGVGLEDNVSHRDAGGNRIWAFLLSIWQVILPALGLWALASAIRGLDILGVAGAQVLDAVLSAGLVILLARWLTGQFFPLDTRAGPLNYDLPVRSYLRSIAVLMGLILAFTMVADAVVTAGDPAAGARKAALVILEIFLAFGLYRFCSMLRRPPQNVVGMSTGRTRRIIGLLGMAIAVLAPILALVGYGNASDALLTPAVLTLAIIAVVMLLQRLVNDVWLQWADSEAEVGPLAPLLIGFALFAISIPFLALVWGARGSDLLEVWAQFRTGFTIGDSTISPTDFLAFVLIFAIGYILTNFFKSTLRSSVLPRTKMDIGGQNAIVAGFGYLGIFLSAVVAISVAGVDLSSIALVAGALSVGIGFGLQTVVSNFVSGIILLIERPVSEGDWIEVNGQAGYVRDISVRSTRIETFDRTDVIIPNADLISGQVTNYTRGNSVGRAIVPVGVAYGTNVELVQSILRDVAEENPMVVLDPPPNVLFVGFGDSSLDFEIRAILRDVNFVVGVKSEMNLQIEKRFREAGIEIPFPQRDVWMRSNEGTS